MKTIKDIRKDYPQYGDLSDEEIADRLYNKHYKDKLSQEDFNKKIGLQAAAETQPAKSIGPDIFPTLLNKAREFNVTQKSAKNSYLDIVDGLLQLYAQQRGDVGVENEIAKEHQKRMSEQQRLSEQAPLSAIAGQMAGGAAAIPVPGIGGLAGSLVKKPLAKAILGSSATGAAEGILGGYLQYAPEGVSRQEQALLGGGLGATLGAGIPVAVPAIKSAGAGLYDKLRPSQLFRGELSPAELNRNLMAARGTETGLGSIIENPFLQKTYENALSHLPFAGAAEAQRRTAKNIINKGENILSEAGGYKEPGTKEIGQLLYNTLQDVGADVEEAATLNYQSLGQSFKNANTKIAPTNFQNQSSEEISRIESDPLLSPEIKKSIKNKLKTWASGNFITPLQRPLEAHPYKKIYKEEGEKKPYPHEFNPLNIFKGKIRELKEQASDQGEKHLAGVYGRLHSALESDIKRAAYESGNPNLINDYNFSQKFFKEEVAPMRTKEIRQFTSGQRDPDTIVKSFLKEDRPTLLHKLTRALSKADNSQESMDTLRYAALSRAVDEEKGLMPDKLSGVYRKMDKDVRDLLFADKDYLKQELAKYRKLTQMNEVPLHQMMNPPTGNKWLAALPWAAIGTGIGTGAGIGGAALGPVGALLGGVAGGVVGSGKGVGTKMTKLLTDEKIREEFVKKMIEGPIERKPFEYNPETLELMRHIVRGASVNASKKKEKEKR